MPFAGYKNFADCTRKNSNKKDPQAYCATIMRATEGLQIWEAEVSTERRKALAKKGYAMDDGSYPIPNVAFLRRAIQAYGRAKNPEATKRHIIKRARALGRTDLLPEDWRGSTKKEGIELPTKPSLVSEIFDAKEAEFKTDETGKMTARVVLIKAGRAKNPRNYRPAALKKAADEGIYDGMRMFLNHSEKPPLKRSLGEMVSAVESTEWDPTVKPLGAIMGNVRFFDQKFFDYTQQARDFMGTSVNHRIKVQKVRENSGQIIEDVEQIVGAHSVDWVIYPSAGGEVISFARESEEVEDVEWDDITLEQLEANAPKLLEEYKTKLAKETESDDDEDDEGTDDSQEEVKLTKSEIQKMVQEQVQSIQKDMSDQASKKEATAKKVREYVGKSGLPARTQARIVSLFSNALEYVEDEVKEAVEDAKAELKEAGVNRIEGMGPSAPSGDDSRKTVTVRESVESFFGMRKDDKDKKATSGAASGKES